MHRSRSMAYAPAVQPVPSWWLTLASRLGRVAIVCLILENFLLLFAPLAFLLGGSPGMGFSPRASVLVAFSDAGFLLSLADLFAVIGFSILAPVLFLLLIGIVKSKRRVPFDTFLLGGALACVVAVIPVKLYAQARAAGTVASLDAVAATGGWSLASGLILAASLLYMFLAQRVEAGVGPFKLSSLKWPLYGAVNLFGSLAIAGFFQGLAAGRPNFDPFTPGLVGKMTPVPLLGVLASRDLLDRFPYWGRLPAAGAPVAAVVRPAPRRGHAARRVHAPQRVFAPRPTSASVRPLPPPPSPENTMRSLPPPPSD